MKQILESDSVRDELRKLLAITEERYGFPNLSNGDSYTLTLTVKCNSHTKSYTEFSTGVR